MERRVIGFLFFMLFCGLVVAEDGWDDINPDSDLEGDVVPVVVDSAPVGDNVDVAASAPVVQNDSSESGKFFTANFYMALGVVLVALIVLGIFIWFWIKGPQNKWEK